MDSVRESEPANMPEKFGLVNNGMPGFFRAMWDAVGPESDAADRLAAHPNAAQAEARILKDLEGV